MSLIDDAPYRAWAEAHDIHPSCWSGVGPGWLPILDRLIAGLAAIGWRGTFAQIKEKFGLLRIYLDAAVDLDEAIGAQANALVRDAEAASARTCEVCGQPGTTDNRPHGWYLTLCSAHHRARRAAARARRPKATPAD